MEDRQQELQNELYELQNEMGKSKSSKAPERIAQPSNNWQKGPQRGVSALNKSNSSDSNNAPVFQSQPDFGHEQVQHKDFYPTSGNFSNNNASKPTAAAKPAQKKKERHYCMDTVEAEEPEVVENKVAAVAAEDQNDLENFLR